MMTLFRLLVGMYERMLNLAVRMWPDASEKMDPVTRADYEQRIAAAKEKLEQLKREAE